MIDQERSHKPPFSARCRDMAANAGAVDHVLPVVGYAEAAQSLLEIQRQFSGSQTPYFTLLDEITQLTKTRIDAEKNVISIAENRDSPFSNGKATGASDNTAVVGAIGQTNQILIAGFRALAGGGGAAIDFRGFASEPFQ